MKTPSRVALQFLLAAGAVVTSTSAASAAPPPCKGWATAAEHTDAGPVQSFNASCQAEVPAFKQGFPIKWTGGS